MKIKSLYIDGYKNLLNVEFFFEEGSTVNAIIGNNGSGKSNVLEALTIIYAAKANSSISGPILERIVSRMAAPPHTYRFPFARIRGFQASGQAVSLRRNIH